MFALADSSARGAAAREALTDDLEWAAPAHTPYEVLRTLRRYESQGVLSPEATTSLAQEVRVAQVRYALPDDDLLGWTWRHRHNLSPYDAPYVGLARRHGVTLVTNDLRLARAARALGVTASVP